MLNPPFRRAALMLTLSLVVPVAGTPLLADQPAWYLSSQTLALSGYDAVAYFTESKAVPGKAEFEHAWNGARWRFASAANRDRFAAAPESYAPQFGGYCAWAVSRGYTASGDPNAWSVVGGKLYLNYSMKVRAQWEQDVPGNIAKGVANWPSVLSK
jgi:YHS domain-containing protein